MYIDLIIIGLQLVTLALLTIAIRKESAVSRLTRPRPTPREQRAPGSPSYLDYLQAAEGAPKP